MAEHILYIVLAYLLGSVPFGYLVGRLHGVDIRTLGSHNIGATNVGRNLGKKWGILVFLLDFLKGFVPLYVYKASLGGDLSAMDWQSVAWLLGVLMALVLGHMFTCYLGFRGGKGVATMAGCIFAFHPGVGGVAAGVFVLLLVVCEYVSLSSLLAGGAMVLAAALDFARDGEMASGEWLALGALGAVLLVVVVKHRENLRRIMAGVEPKVTYTKKIRSFFVSIWNLISRKQQS